MPDDGCGTPVSAPSSPFSTSRNIAPGQPEDCPVAGASVPSAKLASARLPQPRQGQASNSVRPRIGFAPRDNTSRPPFLLAVSGGPLLLLQEAWGPAARLCEYVGTP